jgi:outer membrane cobalamin receptor
LEFKVGSQWLTSITTTSQGDKAQKSGGKGNLGGSVAWSHFMNDLLVYGQIAKASRSPSLLERIGDGAQIEGAPTLAPEDSLALESGARYIFTLPAELRALLGLTWWSRDNSEVIRIDRVSPVRWRARNYGQQKFRGLELRSDLGSDLVGIEAALSWMRASQADSSLLVPKMPLWQSAVGTRWQILERLIFRSMSQYVGRMYHDASNTRELMWTLTHDVSLDYSDAAGVWKVGVSVTNVTNVMSNKIRDTLTDGDQGRIAFSQYNGEPLPGRSLLVSVSAGI